MVVFFIAFLYGVLEVAPIVFLKTAQDQIGSIDFTLISDYSDKTRDGDINVYSVSPFETAKVEKTKGLIQQVKDTINQSGDNFNLFGFNLLNFGEMKEKLKLLEESSSFKGFTPRWYLPTLLRNVSDPSFNTSCTLIVIDSEREYDMGFGNGFDNKILGDGIISASSTALKYLNASTLKMDKLEVFFDIKEIIKTISEGTGKHINVN